MIWKNLWKDKKSLMGRAQNLSRGHPIIEGIYEKIKKIQVMNYIEGLVPYIRIFPCMCINYFSWFKKGILTLYIYIYIYLKRILWKYENILSSTRTADHEQPMKTVHYCGSWINYFLISKKITFDQLSVFEKKLWKNKNVCRDPSPWWHVSRFDIRIKLHPDSPR